MSSSESDPPEITDEALADLGVELSEYMALLDHLQGATPRAACLKRGITPRDLSTPEYRAARDHITTLLAGGAILTAVEGLGILSGIAKDTGQTAKDRMQAVDQLSRILGWQEYSANVLTISTDSVGGQRDGKIEVVIGGVKNG